MSYSDGVYGHSAYPPAPQYGQGAYPSYGPAPYEAPYHAPYEAPYQAPYDAPYQAPYQPEGYNPEYAYTSKYAKEYRYDPNYRYEPKYRPEDHELVNDYHYRRDDRDHEYRRDDRDYDYNHDYKKYDTSYERQTKPKSYSGPRKDGPVDPKELPPLPPPPGSGGRQDSDMSPDMDSGNPSRGTLLVKVVRAVNLPNTDKTGKTDAYVQLTIDGTTEKTTVIKDDLNPTFEETFFMDVPLVESNGKWICQEHLEVKVFDEDRLTRDDLLTGRKVDLTRIPYKQKVNVNVPVGSSDKDGGKLFLEVRAENFGVGAPSRGGNQASAGASAGASDSKKGQYRVTVVKAEGLKGDILGHTDAYVKLTNAGTTQQTKVIEGKNPVFGETFYFNKSSDTNLDVQVFDKDKIGKDDVLGSEKINMTGIYSPEQRVIPCKKGRAYIEISDAEYKAPTVPKQDYQEDIQLNHGDISAFPTYKGHAHADKNGGSSAFDTRSAGPVGASPYDDSDRLPGFRADKGMSSEGTTTNKNEGASGFGAPSGSAGAGPSSSSDGGMIPGTAPPPPKPAMKPGTSSTDPFKDIGTLHITVQKVTGLDSVYDSAVKLMIEDKKIETTKKSSQTPVWNESFKFFVRLLPGNQPGVSLGRVPTQPLEIKLVDKSMVDEIGSGKVNLSHLYENRAQEVVIPLIDDALIERGLLSLILKPLGFGLRHFRGKLRVRVVSATDLRKGDTVQKPDPYVVLKLGGEKFSTRTIESNHNPTFNEAFVFNPEVYERSGLLLSSQSLIVEVFDKEVGRDDSMGSGSIDLDGILRGRINNKVIDLFGNGKLYLELEAEDFGRELAEGGGMMGSGSGSKYSNDPSVMQLRDELTELQRQNNDLEKRNNDDLRPLQMELGLVREQLDRARQQIDHLNGHPSQPYGPGSDYNRSVDVADVNLANLTALERLDAADGKLDGKYFGATIDGYNGPREEVIRGKDSKGITSATRKRLARQQAAGYDEYSSMAGSYVSPSKMGSPMSKGSHMRSPMTQTRGEYYSSPSRIADPGCYPVEAPYQTRSATVPAVEYHEYTEDGEVMPLHPSEVRAQDTMQSKGHRVVSSYYIDPVTGEAVTGDRIPNLIEPEPPVEESYHSYHGYNGYNSVSYEEPGPGYRPKSYYVDPTTGQAVRSLKDVDIDRVPVEGKEFRYGGTETRAVYYRDSATGAKISSPVNEGRASKRGGGGYSAVSPVKKNVVKKGSRSRSSGGYNAKTTTSLYDTAYANAKKKSSVTTKKTSGTTAKRMASSTGGAYGTTSTYETHGSPHYGTTTSVGYETPTRHISYGAYDY